MAFKQGTHDFMADPFLSSELKQFITHMLNLPDQETAFFHLWEQKNQNRVPLCSRCNTQQHQENSNPGTDFEAAVPRAVPSTKTAEYMCTSCMPPTTLCSACCLHSNHDQDHESCQTEAPDSDADLSSQNHTYFPLNDVFSNMFAAAAGLPIVPLEAKTTVHLLSESTLTPKQLSDKDTESDNDADSESSETDGDDVQDSDSDSDAVPSSQYLTLPTGTSLNNEILAEQPTTPSVSSSMSYSDKYKKQLKVQTQLNTGVFGSPDQAKADKPTGVSGYSDSDKSADVLAPAYFMKPVAMNPCHDDLEDLSWPYGLCSSPMGHVMIADTYNHRVLVTNEGNTIYNLGINYDLSYPIGLTCCKPLSPFREHIYVAVADSGNSKIRIFNSEGKQTQEIKDRLSRPHGVCLDFLHIIVSDIEKRTVAKYSFDGRVIQTFSEPMRGPTVTQMEQPSYVECSDDGNIIFVADTLRGNVKVFDNTAGTLITTLGPFQSPHGLCINSEQRTLIVTDFMSSSVDAVDLRKGDIVTNIAGASNGLIGPTDVAFHAPSRQILVLDTTRSKLRQFPISPLPVSMANDFF